MGLASFCFLLGSLRTNICFVGIFTTLLTAFCLLTAAYWSLAEDYQANAARATNLIVVSPELEILPNSLGTINANSIAHRLEELFSLRHACLAGTSSLLSSWRLWTFHCHCLLGTCPGSSSPKEENCLCEGTQF